MGRFKHRFDQISLYNVPSKYIVAKYSEDCAAVEHETNVVRGRFKGPSKITVVLISALF